MKTHSLLFFFFIILKINAQYQSITKRNFNKFYQQEIITCFEPENNILQTIEPIAKKVYIFREYQKNYFSKGIQSDNNQSFIVKKAYIDILRKNEKIPFLEKLNYENFGIEKERRAFETSLLLRENYWINTHKNKKTELRYQNQVLLPKKYERIEVNRAFIIGYNKGKYDIYNTSLRLLAKDVLTYTQQEAYIEYVKNHQVYRIGMEGFSKNNYTHKKLFLCCDIETDTSSEYFLEKDSLNTPTILEKITFYNETSELKYDIIYHFDDNEKFDDIFWLDDTCVHHLERHEHFEVMVINDLLLVIKDNKKAIAYPLLNHQERKIILKYITNFEYDSVHYTDINTPLILSKKHQKFVAHFPNWDGFRSNEYEKPFQLLISEPFKEIQEQHYLFIRYVKENDKKGWYNIKKNTSHDDF